MSRPGTNSPAAHSAPWLVARLFAELGSGTTLSADLRHALDAEGVHDREHFARALLGVMSFASRAGCRPEQVRRFVTCVVRDVATEVLAAPRVDSLVARSVGFLDAVYLIHGTADVDPSSVVAALHVADTLEVLDALAEVDPRTGRRA